ncbi:NPCBM/NEW2 domain-containing protein [Fimbriimonas ginsengisoli]|uniref:Alpha-galactosidase n=1 Tax=Fimbriimonas ginsengisoli Gsoil 348 TaxID=661478 RepID=A0A068NPC8_FIMGI|nr:NPCBM/NEW2 domain-containing protein [Fimbriimonas ginsengisoli]AIE85418.1 Alpha-galactosidase precursor [Fimbriimonas ginsengisoli Gsoil 348]
MTPTLVAALALATQNGADVVRLQDLSLNSMSQDYGAPNVARTVDGNPLKLGGQTFAEGVGTHARSEVIVRLGGQAIEFTATVGVDDETEGKGTVVFRVYAGEKLAFDSGVMHSGDKPKAVKVDLRGAKVLRLLVTDARDGIDHDHADWADARITVLPGKRKAIQSGMPMEPAMKIAMDTPSRTEINGPRVVGGTPGRDFLFRIPASGKRPLRYRATGLPEGLAIDAQRGIVSGRVAKAGRYNATITVEGPGGRDSRSLRLVFGSHQLALTPPMGWNSWNVWGLNVDSDKVRAAADSFVKSGLADAGYAFINIDDGWEAPKRNEDGEITPNAKFPDMSALSTYVHSQGLKLGIYSSPGPQTCGGYLGSWQHEFQDAKTYAKWGIDYLKYDWCSYGNIEPRPDLIGLQKPYRMMRAALDDSGRDIVFSLCQYGMGDVFKWGKQVGGNVWRTTGDITDTWGSMSGIGFAHSEKAMGARPGGFNDPDMLVVGNLGWGPNPRPTRLTPNEQITHITLWSLLAAPLIIGCDLTKLDPFTKAVLTNHDVVEIDQDPIGKAATRRKKTGDLEVWARPLWDGSYAVGLFNRGYERAKISADWKDLDAHLGGSQPVRDLWQRRNVGSFSGGYSAMVPAHGAVLIRVGKISK